MTLNSAKTHYGVEGDAQKRVLEKMREMLGSQASEEQLHNGQALPISHHICCMLMSLCGGRKDDRLQSAIHSVQLTTCTSIVIVAAQQDSSCCAELHLLLLTCVRRSDGIEKGCISASHCDELKEWGTESTECAVWLC